MSKTIEGYMYIFYILMHMQIWGTCGLPTWKWEGVKVDPCGGEGAKFDSD